MLIKVIKRTNLIKSGGGFFLQGGVKVLVHVQKKKIQGYICILKHYGKVLVHV